MPGHHLKLRESCKQLLLLPFVLAVAALFWGGVNVTIAGADQPDKHSKNAHEFYKIRDPKVDPNLSPRERARVQRDAVVKNRADARMFIQRVIVEGQQPGSPSQGGAK